jgi:hypothetical protein
MLVFIHNGYIKIYNSSKCVCWFLRLVLDQSICRRKFGFISVIIILKCINPLNASYNYLYLCAFNLQWLRLVLAVQASAPWSVGPVGTVGQV